MSRVLNFLLVILFMVFPFFKGISQPDDQSNGQYREAYINKTWGKLDKNKNGQFTEEDDKRSWKRLKRFDSNEDNQVSFEEYVSKVQIPYLKTGGKRKLNVLYKGTKEENLYLDIYYPETAKEGEELPVVIYTHGGGWAAGSRHGAANASFKKVHTALLEKGFCVVSVSYRLWEKGGTTSMRDCVIDSKDALRYLSKHSEALGIDTNRFFSFGDSAGGQIAQMLLLSAPESLKGDSTLAAYTYKMKAGVSWYGPCDFEKTSLFNHDDRANFKDRFGARIIKPSTPPEDKLSLYKEMSPINYLNKNSSPLLLIQGDKDTTIPVKHAYYMAEKAKEIGAPITTLIIKNAGHNWRKVGADIEPTREEIIQKTIDYLVSNLKPTDKFTFELGSLFKNHMVLQRGQSIPVWGKAEVGATITVKFANSETSSIVDSNGKWRLDLNALKASFESRTMIISSSLNKEDIKISDIVVGDVWICSGQSNMEWPIGGVPEIKALIPTSSNIRSFTVKNNVAFKPQSTCKGTWVNEHPNSAVAFSFAYYLQQSANVPVGIILTSWGASSIEGWMPREMTKTLPHFKAMMNAFDTNSKTKNRIKTIKNGPVPWSKEDNLFARRQSNILYNAMMHPLIPYACSGLVWYQGESNTQSMHGKKNRNAGMLQYDETLKEWIKTYRKSWNNDAMHFMIVMLPGYGKILDSETTMNGDNPNAHSWAWMRESQLKALELPNTSVVNTIDLGDVEDVHPKDKLPIGQRAALLAMDEISKSDTKSGGPIFKETKTKGNTLVVSFDHAKKLKTKDGKAPTGFWLADDSENWFRADAKIKGKTVVLNSDQLSKPKYIRYAFTAKPEVNLVNEIDLPVYPFRTDIFEP